MKLYNFISENYKQPKTVKEKKKQRLDPKCWKGYKKQGTKMKGGVRVNNCVPESLEALARHVKEGVPLPDSLFRYQSEAYFDTFKTAKKLREAGSLPELDWESEEMLGTDIGESVELKGVGRVWLDVPYLEEAVEEAQEGMIGEPDAYYDAEERRQAYNDLQDALAQSSKVEAQYVVDGHCPECPNVEDDEDCYGFGNYGCDDGILTYDGDDVSWKEIKDHDERQAQRQKAKDEYPGDEEVIKGLANMMKNMDDPRQAYQQMQADYPHMGRAQRSSLIAKAKQMAFPNETAVYEDENSGEAIVAKMLAKALGDENRWSEHTAQELYAELESEDSELADTISDIGRILYGVRMQEAKVAGAQKCWPGYKKDGTQPGTGKNKGKRVNKCVKERALKDVEADDIVTVKMGGVDREFIRKGDMWDSTDPKYPMQFKVGSPTHDKLLNVQRKKQMARSTPSAQAKRKLKVMASEAEYQGKKVQLNKPKRGGSKKYYVYVKSKKGNVKKISFGDPGLKTKAGNKGRAKSFAARHNCEKKNDKTKAGYWACRLPRYGLVKGGKWW
jgi:hypothetical protein